MTPPALNKKRNFTLIELLIAISLFAVVVTALYSALSVGVISWKRGDEGTNLHQKARIILETMVSDIRNCVYFSYIQFVGQAQEIYFPMTIVVTEATKKAKGVFDTNIFKVTYLLQRGSYRDKYKTLMRKQETFLESLDSNVRPKEFASGIADLSFEYIYKTDEESTASADISADTSTTAGAGPSSVYWKNEWKVKNKIPKFVKIKLSLIDESDPESEQTVEFNRTVWIPQGTLETEPTEDETELEQMFDNETAIEPKLEMENE